MEKELFTYDQIFDLHRLLAVPMVATVDADFYTGRRLVEFIREYGFEGRDSGNDREGGNWGRLKTIKFKYTAVGPQGRPLEHTIEIPIISLIPLPLLQVEQAVFDMDILILGELLEDGKKGFIPPALTSGPEKTVSGPLNAPIHPKATLAPHYKQGTGERPPHLSANLKAHLALKQADLPPGIIKILGIIQDASFGKIEARPV
ncbi:MAG: DUF2589 domain-containing protein [Firmicutes bacterium]|nr:DUF2589 domain-containing protein [Bacillota bacterium]